jgi:hypothetical protein
MHVIRQLIGNLQNQDIKVRRFDVILTYAETILSNNITRQSAECGSDSKHFTGLLKSSKYGNEAGDVVLNGWFQFPEGGGRKERSDGIASKTVPIVGDSAEDGVSATEGMGPGWWLVAFVGGAGEEHVVEIGVVDVELMWTDSYDWAVCYEDARSE